MSPRSPVATSGGLDEANTTAVRSLSPPHLSPPHLSPPHLSPPHLPPLRLPSADPWRRFMTASYEAVILFAVVFFFGYGFSALTQNKGQGGPVLIAMQAWMFGVLALYFTWFWCKGRGTLPMKTMQVTLVDLRGAPLSAWRAFARYCIASVMLWGLIAVAWYAAPFGALLLPLPFLWCLFDSDRQTLYDRLSGTRLVRRAA